MKPCPKIYTQKQINDAAKAVRREIGASRSDFDRGIKQGISAFLFHLADSENENPVVLYDVSKLK